MQLHSMVIFTYLWYYKNMSEYTEPNPAIDSLDTGFDSITVNRLTPQRRFELERAAAVRVALVTALEASDLAAAVRDFTLENNPDVFETPPVVESSPEAPTSPASPQVDPPIDHNLSY